MNLAPRLLTVLLLLIFVIKAEASPTKKEYQIPGLIGVHSHIDRALNITFDLKTTFAEIVNVELYLEGSAMPGSAVATDGGQEQFELPVQFDISIAERFIPQSFSLSTPIASFTSLSDNFKTQMLFKPRPKGYTADWSFLKNGTGELHFSWVMDCQGGCRYIQHSTVNITKAVLIVEEVLRQAAAAPLDKATGAPVVTEQKRSSKKSRDKTNEIRKMLYTAQNGHASITVTTESIAKMGKSVVPSLIEIAQDVTDRSNVRSQAILILGNIQDLRAVDSLIELLHDKEDWHLRDQAAYSLVDMTHNNFGKDEKQWINWWSQAKPKYLALVGDCVDKGSNDIEDDLPCWIKEKIAREEMSGVANPPAALYRCVYGGQIAYYLPPRCCDIRSILWDEKGNVICSPDGGITGVGDGRCPALYKGKGECVTIWKDSRSR